MTDLRAGSGSSRGPECLLWMQSSLLQHGSSLPLAGGRPATSEAAEGQKYTVKAKGKTTVSSKCSQLSSILILNMINMFKKCIFNALMKTASGIRTQTYSVHLVIIMLWLLFQAKGTGSGGEYLGGSVLRMVPPQPGLKQILERWCLLYINVVEKSLTLLRLQTLLTSNTENF